MQCACNGTTNVASCSDLFKGLGQATLSGNVLATGVFLKNFTNSFYRRIFNCSYILLWNMVSKSESKNNGEWPCMGMSEWIHAHTFQIRVKHLVFGVKLYSELVQPFKHHYVKFIKHYELCTYMWVESFEIFWQNLDWFPFIICSSGILQPSCQLEAGLVV